MTDTFIRLIRHLFQPRWRLRLAFTRRTLARIAEAVSRSELLARMKKGDVQVLDVRPEDEFALGHLPGALNIPLE